jgi:hypothetical protein
MRLRAQRICCALARDPRDAVSRLLAVQAQDLPGALWAIGLRTAEATLATVERAIAEGAIVRTWPMRGTLHFVAAEDVRWLTRLLATRVSARFETRHRQLGLDDKQLAQARELLVSAMAGGRSITRPAAMALLESGGITVGGQRGYHVLVHLARSGVLVQGPAQGKQQTFVLLEEWVARTPASDAAEARSREEPLAVLAARYFTGHGPATVADLARWASIPKREASGALEAVADQLTSAKVDGERYWFSASAVSETDVGDSAHDRHSKLDTAGPRIDLLPGFDEYMLGYVGRGLQLGSFLERYGTLVGSNGMLAPTVLVDGRAVGVWKRTLRARTVSFEVTPFRRLTRAEERAIAAQQERYAAFFGLAREGG